MSTLFVVDEYNKRTRRLIAHHHVPVKSPGEDGFYREARSWGAFSNAFFPMRRMSRYRQFFVRRMDDHLIGEDAWKRTCKRMGINPHKVKNVRHRSVDAFYARIGYDRKKRKLSKA